MARFNKTKETTITTNLAGGRAYQHSPEMELIVSVLTTFLEDKFYESSYNRIARIKKLIQKVKPEFVAKLAILARKEFHLRSVTHLLVAELSRIHRGDSLVSKTIQKIAERPDDLIEIIAYLGKPLPAQIKKGVAEALKTFDAYQLAKYRMENHKVKLVDLFNLTHPKPVSEEQAKVWKALMTGNLKNTETWEARLSSGEKKAKVWRELLLEEKIGYMALLRNLRNIDEQADDETKQKACEIIANKERVLKSKQLPFRFYTAYKEVRNQDMLEAIAKALDYAVENVPHFEGETLIAIDVSGSMIGKPLEIASIFAGALIKNNNAEVVLYSDTIYNFRYLRNEPVLTLADRIQKEAMWGGTKTSLVFGYAQQSNVMYDRIIILSDNESWIESVGVQRYYLEYLKKNPNVYVYCIDIQGYGTKDISHPRTFHIAGWSEKIFDFMKWIEKENQLIDFVNRIEI